MIRVAIVEDDETYAEQLTAYLTQYGEEHKKGFEIEHFRDGDTIVNGYRARYDIILMDIQMKFMDGMSAAEEIRKLDSEVIIIFVTNMKQYAIRGYAVEALDYIVKPISYFAFSQRMFRAIERLEHKQTRVLILNIKSGVVRVETSDIYYMECQRHMLIYHTARGRYELSGTMKDAEEQLKEDHFFRANKGYLVNLAHVDSIRDDCAVVKNEMLAISRPRKKEFLEALTNYWTEVH